MESVVSAGRVLDVPEVSVVDTGTIGLEDSVVEIEDVELDEVSSGAGG